MKIAFLNWNFIDEIVDSNAVQIQLKAILFKKK